MAALTLYDRLRGLLISTGYHEILGGIDAVDAGVGELRVALILVAAELMNAETRGVDLADADRHRTRSSDRVHGPSRPI